MRWLWRQERWAYSVAVLCAGAFVAPIYYVARIGG